jgi:hypothetical protein
MPIGPFDRLHDVDQKLDRFNDWKGMALANRDAEPFGFGRLTSESRRPGQGMKGRFGPRPTWLILAEPPNAPLAHERAFYQTFFYGRETPSTYAWVMAQYGAPPVPVLGGPPATVHLTQEQAQLQLPSRIPVIDEQALRDIGSYPIGWGGLDADRDGVVKGTELLTVIVDSYGLGNATTQSLTVDSTALGYPLQIRGKYSVMGHQVALQTACHEVFHQWGAIDMYGADQSFHGGLTTMAATITQTPDDRSMVELDAWHRMQFGLTRPYVYDLATQVSGTASISAVAQNRYDSAVLFWDSRRGPGDYLLVELRQATPGTLDSDCASGFVVWQCKVDANGDPMGGLTPNGTYAVNAIGPGGVGDGAWASGSSLRDISWVDGTSIGVEVTLDSPNGSTGTVEWSPRALQGSKFDRLREPL